MKKRGKIIAYVLAGVFIVLAGIFAYFFTGEAGVAKDITWGVDFSQMQAESLGLNWRQVFTDIIKDLKVKDIKLHTQWDWVEGVRDEYYFDDIDWQAAQAENNDVKIIYVVGMKSGRWPECHIPEWAVGLPKEEQQKEILEYIERVILRYKSSPAIAYWQVENEPLFKFGNCPWYDEEFLKKEVALVKSLDSSRQVIISDSGEQSTWVKAAKIADIVGVTMYRKAWFHITDSIGFNMDFLIPPVTYWKKASLINKFFNKKVIGVELQAEPWVSKPFYDVSLEEQEKTMSLQIFKDNVEYAKKTGLDKFYFWGVEWWYWMKEAHSRPEIWNEAKKYLFND